MPVWVLRWRRRHRQPLAGTDLDGVDSNPALQLLADELPGYTETSPSGNGYHAIGYGKPFPALGSNSTGIEAYSSGRFLPLLAMVPGYMSHAALRALLIVVWHLHTVAATQRPLAPFLWLLKRIWHATSQTSSRRRNCVAHCSPCAATTAPHERMGTRLELPVILAGACDGMERDF